MTSPSLEDLLKEARQGNKKSYAHFLAEVTSLVRPYIRKKLSSPEDQEDVIQDTLMSIHRSQLTYDLNRPIKPWIMAIATYRINDHLRKHYKKRENEVVDFDSIAEFLEDNVTNPQTDNELTNIVNTLPEKQRKIVYMLKVEGYSIKEIAKAMSMSESAVKVAAHRSYKKLKEKILAMEKEV